VIRKPSRAYTAAHYPDWDREMARRGFLRRAATTLGLSAIAVTPWFAAATAKRARAEDEVWEVALPHDSVWRQAVNETGDRAVLYLLRIGISSQEVETCLLDGSEEILTATDEYMVAAYGGEFPGFPAMEEDLFHILTSICAPPAPADDDDVADDDSATDDDDSAGARLYASDVEGYEWLLLDAESIPWEEPGRLGGVISTNPDAGCYCRVGRR
jgi:hypothetical protein